MGNSSSVLESVTSFEDINDIKKALEASPEPADVVKAFHASCYVSTTCQRLQCILELFLRHGVDVNARDPANQWTILHHAFASQKTFVLPYLLSAGAKASRDINGLSPVDYLPKSKYDHFVRAYVQQSKNHLTDREPSEEGSGDANGEEAACEIHILHDWKRDTHELGELLHVKCKGGAGYVQLIYHENDSIDALQDEAVFDQFINVEGERTISFSTSHIPAMAIVHVLYVTCDKQMMHRQVRATDGPLCVQANVEKYIFTVNGEAFHHANPVLDGMVFPTMREFQQFMKMMKSDKIQGEPYVEESRVDKVDTQPSNQDETEQDKESNNLKTTAPEDSSPPEESEHPSTKVQAEAEVSPVYTESNQVEEGH